MNGLRKIWNGVLVIVKAIVVGLLVVMTLTIVAGVVFRYVLLQPLYWSEELARYCMIWMALLGSVLALVEKGHVGVVVFVNALPAKAGEIVSRAGNVAVAAFLLMVFCTSIPFLISTEGQTSSALELPMFIPYLSVTVGALLMAVAALQHAFEKRKVEPTRDMPTVCHPAEESDKALGG